MFMPVPQGPEKNSLSLDYEAHDPEPSPEHATWRPRGRWPALLRLSWLLWVIALFHLVVGVLALVIGVGVLLAGGNATNGLPAVIWGISALVSVIFWLGLAELILLLIAVERNSRQTRDRLPKHPPRSES